MVNAHFLKHVNFWHWPFDLNNNNNKNIKNRSVWSET